MRIFTRQVDWKRAFVKGFRAEMGLVRDRQTLISVPTAVVVRIWWFFRESQMGEALLYRLV
jgi:hypothetical protein